MPTVGVDDVDVAVGARVRVPVEDDALAVGGPVQIVGMNRERGQPTEMGSVRAHGEHGSLLGQVLASEPCEDQVLSVRREPRLPIVEPGGWDRDPPQVRSIDIHDVDALLVGWVPAVGFHGDRQPVRRPGRLSTQSLRVRQQRHVGSVGSHGEHVVDDVRVVRVRIGPVAVEHEGLAVGRQDGPAAVRCTARQLLRDGRGRRSPPRPASGPWRPCACTRSGRSFRATSLRRAARESRRPAPRVRVRRATEIAGEPLTTAVVRSPERKTRPPVPSEGRDHRCPGSVRPHSADGGSRSAHIGDPTPIGRPGNRLRESGAAQCACAPRDAVEPRAIGSNDGHVSPRAPGGADDRERFAVRRPCHPVAAGDAASLCAVRLDDVHASTRGECDERAVGDQSGLAPRFPSVAVASRRGARRPVASATYRFALSSEA